MESLLKKSPTSVTLDEWKEAVNFAMLHSPHSVTCRAYTHGGAEPAAHFEVRFEKGTFSTSEVFRILSEGVTPQVFGMKTLLTQGADDTHLVAALTWSINETDEVTNWAGPGAAVRAVEPKLDVADFMKPFYDTVPEIGEEVEAQYALGEAIGLIYAQISLEGVTRPDQIAQQISVRPCRLRCRRGDTIVGSMLRGTHISDILFGVDNLLHASGGGDHIFIEKITLTGDTVMIDGRVHDVVEVYLGS